MNKKDQLTQKHYELYPFFSGGEKRIEWWKNKLFQILPPVTTVYRSEHDHAAHLIDVGCGPGEITSSLIKLGYTVTALDHSALSIQLCKDKNPSTVGVCASVLDLPFSEKTFDGAISIGVLHHTSNPKLGFQEIARVTKPEGWICIFLYQPFSFYHFLYYFFKPFRALITPLQLSYLTFPILKFFFRKWMKVEVRRKEIENLLADQLWHPQVHFISKREILKWSKELGLVIIHEENYLGRYARIYVLKEKPLGSF